MEPLFRRFVWFARVQTALRQLVKWQLAHDNLSPNVLRWRLVLSQKHVPNNSSLAYDIGRDDDWLGNHSLADQSSPTLGHNYAKRISGDAPMGSREKFVPDNLIRSISNLEDESSREELSGGASCRGTNWRCVIQTKGLLHCWSADVHRDWCRRWQVVQIVALNVGIPLVRSF